MGAQPGTMGRSDQQSPNVANIDDRARFVRNGLAADPRGAARERAQFGTWLETHFTLGAGRFSDVLLAANEAIDRTPHGTRVTLTWTDLTQRSDA